MIQSNNDSVLKSNLSKSLNEKQNLIMLDYSEEHQPELFNSKI